MNSIKDRKGDNTYEVSVSAYCHYISMMLLAALVISIIPLLLNDDNTVFFTSQPLYVAILLLFAMVMYFNWWGLFVGAIMFAICGIVADMPLSICLTNGFANILQLALFLLSYKLLKKIKEWADGRGMPIRVNRYDEGVMYFNMYNFFLLIAGLLYIVFSIFLSEHSQTIMYVFSGVVLFMTILKIYHREDKTDLRLLVYTLGLAFLPSLASSAVSYYLGAMFSQTNVSAYEYMSTWTMSNYVLMQTFGYICYQIFYSKNFDVNLKLKSSEAIPFDISCIMYYVAVFVWNLLILYLIKQDSQNMKYMFFFPWALGNAFLLTNLYFCGKEKQDVSEGGEFKWFEDRIVVVEKNTSSIIMIVAFLLPLSLQYLNAAPTFLKTLFIANIFCVSIAVGLIWTPKSYVKFISLLKTLKTIFYTYSVSLLLLCVVVLMRCL